MFGVRCHIRRIDGRGILAALQRVTDDYDKNKQVKTFTKIFAYSGGTIEHPGYREVIWLQGA